MQPNTQLDIHISSTVDKQTHDLENTLSIKPISYPFVNKPIHEAHIQLKDHDGDKAIATIDVDSLAQLGQALIDKANAIKEYNLTLLLIEE